MKTFLFTCLLFIKLNLFSQELLNNNANSLRGALTSERIWWDARYYGLEVRPNYDKKSINGIVNLGFKVVENSSNHLMQIDLQYPMQIDSVKYKNVLISILKSKYSENVYYVDFTSKTLFNIGAEEEIIIFFSGIPKIAKTPPWDGGWIWTKDKKNREWISLACQGLGASVWFPCKDHQSDEPEKGIDITIHCDKNLKAISNGKLVSCVNSENETDYHWKVENPINLYDITVNIGAYVAFDETYKGEKGDLSCQYWVLDYELNKAKKQFKQVPKLLKSFEYWMGPYPFYEDGYKVIQTPFLGMEHQSGIAYGNDFKNGYKSSDLSGSGWGMKFDFILVHESGHEWFGNNITSKDLADLWIHEAFTTYSEVLYLDYWFNTKAGDVYVKGIRNRIQNDTPIIARYDLNEEGSGDMYFKGANLVHILRQLMDNDEKFRLLLREMNTEFYHSTVTSVEFEQFIQSKFSQDISKIFDQYLRTIQIPILEYKIENNQIQFCWKNCVKGFNMPVKLSNGQWIYPTDELQIINNEKVKQKKLELDSNFYVFIKEL